MVWGGGKRIVSLHDKYSVFLFPKEVLSTATLSIIQTVVLKKISF